MKEVNVRSKAQKKAESKQDEKRKSLPRYGGRCTDAEKKLLVKLTKKHADSEKEMVFKALRFYEKNYNK